jgi:hypothetical protein
MRDIDQVATYTTAAEMAGLNPKTIKYLQLAKERFGKHNF